MLTCLLLATTRYCRMLQCAPISFSIASLQMFRTTSVVRRLAAHTTLRNLNKHTLFFLGLKNHKAKKFN